MGLPKSARLSIITKSIAFAMPGMSSGPVTVRSRTHGVARRVWAASSSATSSARTTPESTRKAMGVNAMTCAIATPSGPKKTPVSRPRSPCVMDPRRPNR